MPKFIVDCFYDCGYHSNGIEVEASNADEACEKAMEFANDDSGGWPSSDWCGETYINSISEGDAENQIAVPTKRAGTYAQYDEALIKLRAIVKQRNHYAEHGKYADDHLRPADDQSFDDWAADLASTIIAASTGE